MSDPNWANKTIWTGDNLPIMRGMNSDSVDLIYLDPPFNSKHNYSAPIGSKAAGAEFKDTWGLSDIDLAWLDLLEAKHPVLNKVIHASTTNSDKSYLIYMSVRILEMKRILKPTGSIYLHCDPTMSHYLKLVMDAVFGRNNFVNEIVWCYKLGGRPKKGWPKKHDCLLFYRAGKILTFNSEKVRIPYESTGGYISSGRKIVGNKEYKVNPKGKVPEDWWPIPALNHLSKERVGYPTQKPLALLNRIIEVSSNKDDIVLDPFCGCATACVSADNLERQWIGIDISEKAAELVRRRIDDLTRKIVHRDDIPRRTDLGKLPPYRSHAKALYGEQGGNCAGCGTHFEARNLEVDHIISRRNGGTDHIENLQLLCGNCNRIKGNRGMEYLKTKLEL